MSKTARFRDQHVEMVGVVKKLAGLLNADKLSKDASEARQLLSELAGKLKMHLAAEDNALYPQLLAHTDAKIKGLASQFQKEMGGIKDAFEGYIRKWSTPQTIQADAKTFVTETNGVFQVLAKRIEKEDNELYPLVDKT